MNILTISGSAWDDRNSVGNTYSNLLGEMDDVKLYNIYCREAAPYNKYCKEYYTVTATDLIKNLFHRSRIGRRFSYEFEEQPPQKQENAIERTNAFLKGWIRNIGLLTLDCLYNNSWWQNDKFKAFIAEAAPDIVFCFGIADAYRFQILKYLKKHTNAKIVTFIVDDVYWATKRSGNLLGWIESRRYKSLLSMSDKVYGISQEMCDAYSKEFDCKVNLLHKGCELSEPMAKVNKPLDIVYAGNLLYGRDEILGKLADALVSINNGMHKATLHIYTGSAITPRISELLNRGESSRIEGSRPYSEIQEVMKQADIVLHVESFDEKQKEIVRYSFSTKITDCLQSGAVMMAIGPSGIASIEYPKRIPGAIVVDDLSCIKSSLQDIVDTPLQLIQRAESIHAFAESHHAINKVRDNLKNDFNNLIS